MVEKNCLQQKEYPTNRRGGIAEQIRNAPDLFFFGRKILSPQERKDEGAIEYTTVPDTISHWREDPTGSKKFDFIAKAYGISSEDLPNVLSEAGLGEYMEAKSEGRMVGMVSTQLLKPTNYFSLNPIILAELSRRGIPTALMIAEYPQDKFCNTNSDKRNAFGKIDFPVGVKTRLVNGEEIREMQTVQIELRPYGIRHDDGSITRISNIDQANGYRCDQILAQVIDAKSPDNKLYVEVIDDGIGETGVNKSKIKKTHYQGALGLEIPGLINKQKIIGKKEVVTEVAENAISITDFYRILWKKTIARLRQTGDLPSENEMPMFFVDVKKMYTVLAENAKPPKEVLDMLAFSSPERVLKEVLKVSDEEAAQILSMENGFTDYLASKDLKQLENGLLVHLNGVMGPESYYVLQLVWPDIFGECSSCGGKLFVDKLKRAQEVRKMYDLPESEVRIPDIEVPELEGYVVHPTGRYYGYQQSPNEEKNLILEEIANNGLNKEKRTELKNRLDEINQEEKDAHFARIGENDGSYTVTDPYIPEVVAAVYKMFLEGVPEVVE